MDGSSLSSLSEEESSKQLALPKETNKERTSLHSGQLEDLAQTEKLISGEEQITLITESMSITSADQEKLQLLNKNTELRRLNKELMKLNEDWDHIYRSTSAGLQQRVATLEQESLALKQLNSRLLIKVEHEQNKSEYYEHTLMQELKKNQHLQEYIRLLESRLHHNDTLKDWALGTKNISAAISPPEVHFLERSPKYSTSTAPSLELHHKTRSSQAHSESHEKQNDAIKEVQDLKEQLEALRCQTKIYEADYKIEHKDHERMLRENKRLRHREGEMRQQMALLQEQVPVNMLPTSAQMGLTVKGSHGNMMRLEISNQAPDWLHLGLKVYEDDFQKERSDKQLLQRLLMKKSPMGQEPALIHRCNNDQERPRAEPRRIKEEHRAAFMCPKHCENRGHLEYP